jgi:hypothetical protein
MNQAQEMKMLDQYYSLQAEGALLASMIVDGENVIGPLLERFCGADLYRPEHREIFSAIVDCWRANDGKVDLVLLAEWLKVRGRLSEIGGVDYLVEVAQSVPASSSWEYYARIVVDCARLRTAHQSVRGALRHLESDGPIDERLTRCEELLAARTSAASPMTEGDCQIELVSMDAIDPIQTEWLWPNVIPMGMISLLVGQPGQGKSFVSMDIAARVTTGRPWPDSSETPTTPGSVVIFSFEEDLHRTVRGRLDSCGADAGKIKAFRSIRTPTGLSDTIDIQTHLPQLERAVKTLPDLRMILFDPITSCLGAADQNSQAEVRNALTALQNFAQRTGIAIVGISHFAKRTDTSAIYRVLGSVSFAAVSRSIWCVHREPVTPEQPHPRRLFLPVKNNYAIEPAGLSFDIVAGAIEWGILPITDDTDDILSNRRERPSGSKKHDAMQFLREHLEGKPPMESDALIRLAEEKGLTRSKLYDAKRDLGIEARKTGFSGAWVWSFPSMQAELPSLLPI